MPLGSATWARARRCDHRVPLDLDIELIDEPNLVGEVPGQLVEVETSAFPQGDGFRRRLEEPSGVLGTQVATARPSHQVGEPGKAQPTERFGFP